MNYPTLEQVETADREQLAKWYRFLPSPGLGGSVDIGGNYTDRLLQEANIMTKICERFKAMGMFTPELSKQIGLNPKKYK